MPHPRGATRHAAGPAGLSLYSPGGQRKYLTSDERQRVLAQLGRLPVDKALLCEMLLLTGARVSELLALSARDFMPAMGVVAIRTLKRRTQRVVREIPLPFDLL